jgi:hypothetical protein
MNADPMERTPTADDAPDWALSYDATGFPLQAMTADVVGFTLDLGAAELQMLTVVRGGEPFRGLDAWPGGYVDAYDDVDARAAALRELLEETGCTEPSFLETLDTYDRIGRDPRQYAGRPDAETGEWVYRGARVFSKAQLALFRVGELAPGAGDDAVSVQLRRVYDYLPWEDLREAEGQRLARKAARELDAWASATASAEPRGQRQQRVQHAFGESLQDWNEERVSERYALLFEAGLLEEAHRDRWGRVDEAALERCAPYGRALAFDHRHMLADALSRLRGKIKYVPATLHALLPLEFTLLDLQLASEAIGGRRLYKANFRQRISRSETYRIVKPLGRQHSSARPGPRAELHCFPRDVLLLRLDPSIRMPWVPLPEEE